jgi:hypothetical protein
MVTKNENKLTTSRNQDKQLSAVTQQKSRADTLNATKSMDVSYALRSPKNV